MVHPRYWSLDSIYRKLSRKNLVDHISEYNTLNVKDKVVLDIGASNGDAAKFFLKNGAKKVICIEAQEKLAKQITNPNCGVIIDYFHLKHLEIPHDCCKIDIEGYEEILLEKDPFKLKPTIMEVHGQ